MDIIRRHKKKFILAILLSAVISLILCIPFFLFHVQLTNNNKVVVTNESNIIENDKEPLTHENLTDALNPQFENGVAAYKFQRIYDDKTTSATSLFNLNLEEGDLIEVSYKVKRKKGALNFYLTENLDFHTSFGGTSIKGDSNIMNIYNSGIYELYIETTDFKGIVDVDILIKRDF